MSERPIIDIQALERDEKTCAQCGTVTTFHSIDGGLTSTYQCSGCGHKWSISPFGREEDKS